MAISTRNLDAFQNKFNRVVDSGHEVQAKVNKRGEAFLVKGRGASVRSKIWFAIKHPQVSSRDGHARTKHRNVIKALETAARRDIGPSGPKVIKAYLKTQGIGKSDRISKAQVKDAITLVKMSVFSRFEKGKAPTWKELSGNTVVRNILEDHMMSELNDENLHFMEDVDRVLDILDGNTSNTMKKAAYDMLINRYVKNGAERQVNLYDSNHQKLMKGAALGRSPSNADIAKLKTFLKSAHREVWKIIKHDAFVRLSATLQKGSLPKNESLLPVDEVRESYDPINMSALKTKLRGIVDDALRLGNREERLKSLLSTPLGRAAFETYVQKVGLEEDSFYMMEEAARLLEKFPKGGPKFQDAVKKYVKLFVGKPNDPLFANVHSRLSKALKTEVAKTPMDAKKVRELMEKFHHQGRNMMLPRVRVFNRELDKVTTLLETADPKERNDTLGLTTYRNQVDTLAKDNDVAVKMLQDKLKKNLTRTPGLRRHFDKLTYSELEKLSKIGNALQQRNEAVKILSGRGVDI